MLIYNNNNAAVVIAIKSIRYFVIRAVERLIILIAHYFNRALTRHMIHLQDAIEQ